MSSGEVVGGKRECDIFLASVSSGVGRGGVNARERHDERNAVLDIGERIEPWPRRRWSVDDKTIIMAQV